MKSFQVDGQNFVIGMKWSQLSGESLKADVAAYANENSCKYGVIRKVTNDDNVQQIQLGMMNQNVKKGWSAAGVLAELHPNIVLVDEIGGSYWICAVYGGLVLPGGDIVVSNGEDVNNKIDEIINLIGGETEIVISVSSVVSEKLDVVGNVSKSFSELISGESKNFGAQNQVVGLKGIPKALLLGGVFLILCGGLLYALMPAPAADTPRDDFSDLTEMTLPGNVKFSASEMASGVISSSASTEKILDAARQEEIMWLTDDFNSNASLETIKKFVDTYASIPTELSGWNKSGADFDYSDPTKLNVLWTKNTGTGLMLQNSLKATGVNVGISIDGKKGSSYYPVDKNEKSDISDVLAFIRNSDYKRMSLTNDLDMAGISWAATKHTDTTRPIAIEGIKDRNISQTRQLKSNISDYTITGSGLSNMVMTASILDQAKTFITTRIVIQSDKQNWTIYGALYE